MSCKLRHLPPDKQPETKIIPKMRCTLNGHM
jgi:hypothetical protein